ncbi:MAG: HlyD family type I secretion periplasmic adaptor subunit [Rhodospirillales bacterium]|nr:HlyD family type I secretion periplasmic adaptor subunit [Rhodospirillales bacterium]
MEPNTPTQVPESDIKEAVQANFISKSQFSGANIENTLELDRDTVIFSEGEESNFAYVVLEGRVELTKDVGGTDIFLAEIGAGDLFGEMGVIDGNTRSATATTLETTTLQKFDRDELMDRLGKDSDFAAPILSQLVRKLRDTSDRLAHEQVLNLQRAADEADVIAPKDLSTLERLKGFFDTDQDLIEFQPDAVEIERQKTPPVAKVMLYVIVAFIIGSFVWANESTVDTAVSALGRITTEVPNIIVQPSETALIRTIEVKEGDTVVKGQLLATLDATVETSDVESSKAAMVSLSAKENRLEAEFTGVELPDPFSPSTIENNLQMELFKSRSTTLRDQLASFDSQIKQIKSEISTNVQDAKDLGEQVAVLTEIEKMRSKLMDDGYGSRVNYLSAKHQRLSVDREQRSLLSMRTRLEHQMNSLRSDRGAMLSSWQSDVAEELVKTRREREKMSEQLIKTEYRESLVQLIAPAPGVVLSIADWSVGSVIKQADPMFTIVPANVSMEMEVDVLPKDIGLIQVGDFVRIKLDALPFQKHGIVEGKVRLISEDAVESESSDSGSIYRARIEIQEKKWREVPDSFRFTPGLSGSADITVGKRKIITYFIYPLIRAMESSFHES